MDRRSLLAALAGGAVSSAALAVPVTKAVGPQFEPLERPADLPEGFVCHGFRPAGEAVKLSQLEAEDPYRRLRRLAKEMSVALAEIAHHPVAPAKLVAIVHRDGAWGYPTGTVDEDEFEQLGRRLSPA